MNSLVRPIDMPLRPGSLLYELVFRTMRAAYRLRLQTPNTRVHYLQRDDWILVLTPLAGSSSLRAALDGVLGHDVTLGSLPASAAHVRTLYLLSRPFQSRMRTFYNKKVRNPTSLPKARLLASCPPLSWRTSPEEFVDWTRRRMNRLDKDKHLYTEAQIVIGFGASALDVVRLDIVRDADRIEALLGIRIGDRVNSTGEVASFAPPLSLPELETTDAGSETVGSAG